MSRRELIRHLRQHGCVLAREGSDHSIWENPANGCRTAVPRSSGDRKPDLEGDLSPTRYTRPLNADFRGPSNLPK